MGRVGSRCGQGRERGRARLKERDRGEQGGERVEWNGMGSRAREDSDFAFEVWFSFRLYVTF